MKLKLLEIKLCDDIYAKRAGEKYAKDEEK